MVYPGEGVALWRAKKHTGGLNLHRSAFMVCGAPSYPPPCDIPPSGLRGPSWEHSLGWGWGSGFRVTVLFGCFIGPGHFFLPTFERLDDKGRVKSPEGSIEKGLSTGEVEKALVAR
ncbi:hypothetical protein GOBAR_AA26222 [Gossypium barbadense]|uniref:Uncharacterized protein n=1 Tax=Gossypium barbadense TaxID=3634 RepID=A0A2P5WTN6_GOSBA|nr:hypothetical protein GOBAR_AA26222 [Gossypium barbadense]